MTSIGRLTERLALQRATLTNDTEGGKAKTFSTYATVWGALEPLNGRESLLAEQVTAVLAQAVTIWFRTDVSVTDRIQVRGRTLQIESFQDLTGFRDELRLMCSEVQA